MRKPRYKADKAIRTAARRKAVDIQEGMIIYCMGRDTLTRIATEAGALFRDGKKILIIIDLMDEYMALKAKNERRQNAVSTNFTAV